MHAPRVAADEEGRRGLIHDDNFREKATVWMVQTIKCMPFALCEDFIGFVFQFYTSSIAKATACLCLKSLGFSFTGQLCTYVYFDGHERVDVVKQGDTNQRSLHR